MARRARTDSVAGQLAVMRQVSQSIDWPSIVQGSSDPERRAVEVECFNALIAERAIDQWSVYSIQIAARAACLSAFVMAEQAMALEEGGVILGGRHNTEVTNPRLSAIQMANSALTMMLRQLGMAAASSTERKTNANGGVAARTAKAALARAKDHPLLMGDDLLA